MGAFDPISLYDHHFLHFAIHCHALTYSHLELPVPLGLESYVIPDSSLTASSEYSADHGPKRGRLNLARVGNLRGAWCAEANDANQWIQVRK